MKVVVIGAGPVGALAALYAAKRGHDVEVYELRGDIRNDNTTPLNFTKSINLALSTRGITALEHSQCPALLARILSSTIPMYGRMIHSRSPTGRTTEQAQAYDAHGRFIRAADRAELNKALINELASFDNVKLYFEHKLTGADLERGRGWVEDRSRSNDGNPRPDEPEISFDLLIGADGAHSAVRYHLMKFARVTYHQEYINTLWCEFHIAPKPSNLASYPPSSATQGKGNEGKDFAISPNHLHIWPTPPSSEPMMFIAIPSSDKSFTCTLFAPPSTFQSLSSDPEPSVPAFFETNFPGISPNLIPPSDLIQQFKSNPHLPLVSIKCRPHHHTSTTSTSGAVILGDAAHAMVPFYGQGMNAGLEDVRVLFQHLDAQPNIAQALDAYTEERVPDAHAIVDLSMQNFEEMRSSVTNPLYKARKAVEEWISVLAPWTGVRTQYSRVSFGDEGYASVVSGVERQGKILGWGGVGVSLATVGLGLGSAQRAGILRQLMER